MHFQGFDGLMQQKLSPIIYNGLYINESLRRTEQYGFRYININIKTKYIENFSSLFHIFKNSPYVLSDPGRLNTK